MRRRRAETASWGRASISPTSPRGTAAAARIAGGFRSGDDTDSRPRPSRHGSPSACSAARSSPVRPTRSSSFRGWAGSRGGGWPGSVRRSRARRGGSGARAVVRRFLRRAAVAVGRLAAPRPLAEHGPARKPRRPAVRPAAGAGPDGPRRSVAAQAAQRGGPGKRRACRQLRGDRGRRRLPQGDRQPRGTDDGRGTGRPRSGVGRAHARRRWSFWPSPRPRPTTAWPACWTPPWRPPSPARR